jgi:hypothetical protein
MKVYGQLERAQLENLGSAPAAGVKGRVYFDTVGSLLKMDDGSVIKTFTASGDIVNADINASAAIAGTKISPNFGSQNILTTGTLTAKGLAYPTVDGSSGQFIKTDGAGTLSWATAPGTVGTSSGSSTDNCIVRFDGTGGATIQNSGVIISDANNVSGIAQLSFATITAASANTVVDTYTRTTGTSVAARGVAISSSSGSFLYNTDASYVDVTNLSVTIVTSGRPVMLMIVAAGTSASSQTGLYAESIASAGHISMFIRLVRDVTTILDTTLQQYIPASSGVGIIMPGGVPFIDAPAAGTYTYKVQVARGNSNSSARVNSCKLVAFEL